MGMTKRERIKAALFTLFLSGMHVLSPAVPVWVISEDTFPHTARI